jgi:GntR family transcriptional repressor for pyruvate dehydrogenase complex
MQLLIGDIVSGAIPVGQALPPEAALSAELGVSRGVVRETIRGLEERGLVSVRHGSGTTVTEERRWNVLDPDVLGILIQSGAHSSVLLEYLETREILEVEAAGLAAEKATADDLAAISSALARYESAAQRALVNRAAEAFVSSADIDFHQAILRATGNRVLSRVVEPIHHALLMTRRPLLKPEIRFERTLGEHRRIAAAVAAQDANAARAAMADHLSSVGALLMDQIEAARSGGEIGPPVQDSGDSTT